MMIKDRGSPSEPQLRGDNWLENWWENKHVELPTELFEQIVEMSPHKGGKHGARPLLEVLGKMKATDTFLETTEPYTDWLFKAAVNEGARLWLESCRKIVAAAGVTPAEPAEQQGERLSLGTAGQDFRPLLETWRTSRDIDSSADLSERMKEIWHEAANERKAPSTEENIQKILDVLIPDSPGRWVEAEIQLDNAKLRSEYLRETPLLTESQVYASQGLNERNENESVSRWMREGKLFAVRWSGVDLYPAFQFAGGIPTPVIERILAVLPKDMTGWQIAMWFASGNGWLEGAEPKDRLSDPVAVIEAAEKLSDLAIG